MVDSKTVQLKETYRGDFISVTSKDIETMTRMELINYLELRGFACYDDESTSELRETAFFDVENG
jgi:hypothetical protein